MDRKKGYLFLILTFTIWGSLYVVSKYALGKLPPFTISNLRFILAYAALSFLQNRKAAKIEKEDYKYIAFIGIAGYFGAVGFQMLGTKYAGPSIASLLNSLNPVTMSIFAAIFLHEKMTAVKVGGTVLAISGVYVILGKGAAGASQKGILFSLAAVLLWSAMSVITRKITQKYDSIKITRAAIGIAVICYLPVSIYETMTIGKMNLDLPCVAALLYMGIVCTGISYLLWNKSLALLEAGTCSAFYPIQPLISTVLGVLFLGERIGPSFVLGAVLIVSGVLISLKNTRKR